MAEKLFRNFSLAVGIFIVMGCAVLEGRSDSAQPTRTVSQITQPAQVSGEGSQPTPQDTPVMQAEGGTTQANVATYTGHGFSFTTPRGWITHEGPSASGQNAWNYYALNLTILLEVKSPDKLPMVSITTRELPPGSSLEQEFNATYTPIADQIQKAETGQSNVDGLAAMLKRYTRPWGEPWYAFEDTWIEKNGRIYVVSCLYRLTRADGDNLGCNAILSSLHFQ